jgi:hypothetical protein
VAVREDDLHWPQGNLLPKMTLDNARVKLCVVTVVSCALGSLIMVLRMHARGRLVHWCWSDWLNGKPGLSNGFTAAANIAGRIDIRESEMSSSKRPAPFKLTLEQVFALAFWISVSVGLSRGLGRGSSSDGESDRRAAALV